MCLLLVDIHVSLVEKMMKHINCVNGGWSLLLTAKD